MAIQVGVLGFAHGHANSYCEQWKRHAEYGVQVVAGWDHQPERLEAAHEDFSIEKYTEVDLLLSRNDIQAVVIASETSMHADLVERAAAKGKAIILQKPMALTLAEADRIVEAVNKHAVPFTMAWQMRVDPQNRQMKHLLQSGQFGKVFMVRRRHGLIVGLLPEFTDSWHVDPAYNRDIWADDASHPVDFIHWLLGVPQTVTAEIESLYNPEIPMDNGVALYRYPNGPLAEVSCSFTCTGAENTTEIICEHGTIIQNFGDATSGNIPRPGSGSESERATGTNPRSEETLGLKWFTRESNAWTFSEIATPENHGFRISGLAKPLADFLNGRRKPIATAEEGRTSLRMVLATYVSSREGRRVQLADPAIAKV